MRRYTCNSHPLVGIWDFCASAMPAMQQQCTATLHIIFSWRAEFVRGNEHAVCRSACALWSSPCVQKWKRILLIFCFRTATDLMNVPRSWRRCTVLAPVWLTCTYCDSLTRDSLSTALSIENDEGWCQETKGTVCSYVLVYDWRGWLQRLLRLKKDTCRRSAIGANKYRLFQSPPPYAGPSWGQPLPCARL